MRKVEVNFCANRVLVVKLFVFPTVSIVLSQYVYRVDGQIRRVQTFRVFVVVDDFIKFHSDIL